MSLINPPANDAQAFQDRRDHLKGRLTFWRVAELETSPVVGNFDAVHLEEINRRIFQMLVNSRQSPALGSRVNLTRQL